MKWKKHLRQAHRPRRGGRDPQIDENSNKAFISVQKIQVRMSMSIFEIFKYAYEHSPCVDIYKPRFPVLSAVSRGPRTAQILILQTADRALHGVPRTADRANLDSSDRGPRLLRGPAGRGPRKYGSVFFTGPGHKQTQYL